jgi:hypothetical protein
VLGGGQPDRRGSVGGEQLDRDGFLKSISKPISSDFRRFPFSMTRLPLEQFSTPYMKNQHTSYTVYKNPKTKKPKEIKA